MTRSDGQPRIGYGDLKAWLHALPVGVWIPMLPKLTKRTIRSMASRYRITCEHRLTVATNKTGMQFVFKHPPLPQDL